MKWTSLVSACVVLSGCVSTTPPLSSYDADRLSMFATTDLCKALQEEGGPKNVRDEIERRGVFTKDEIDAIAQQEMFFGMSEDALLCSWGRPDDINRTVGAWGVHSQWVYERGYYGSESIYVYLENGLVKSYQD